MYCFGCGLFNEYGLQIKSCWDGDELVCRWYLFVYYIGYFGMVYGGVIVLVVDCYVIWMVLVMYCCDEGFVFDGIVLFLFVFVIGWFVVNYFQFVFIGLLFELCFCVVDCGDWCCMVVC